MALPHVDVSLSSMAAPLPFVTFTLTAIVMGIAVIAGGSSQHAMISTPVVQLTSLPLLALGLWLAARKGLPGLAWPLAIMIAGVAVAGVQLIPLPVGIWSLLPGRDGALRAINVASAHPGSLPSSLNPSATARALVSLAPGAAVFLGVAALDWKLRSPLVWLLLALGAISAVLGMAQATGRLSGFYTITNSGSALGFFANRNHFAALLYACLPFAAALAASSQGVDGGISRPAAIASATLAALLMIGVVASGSRAGQVLLIAALLGCAMLLARARERASRMLMVIPAAVGVLILLVCLQFSRIGTLSQHKTGAFDEDRRVVTVTTLRAANTYAPLGSGLGTFVPVYAGVEPNNLLSPEYFNHAHDDLAELWLEGGWPMAMIVVVFLGWYGLATLRAWRPACGPLPRDVALARAGSVAVAVLLLHSTVDFPVRTGAIMAEFGIACALLAAPTPNATRSGRLRVGDAPRSFVGLV